MVASPPPIPEVDPELAELEEQAHKGKSIIRTIQERLLRTKGTPRSGQDPQRGGTRDKRHEMGMGRRTRRAMARGGKDPDRRKTPHARLGRAKARTPIFIQDANYRNEVRKALSRIKTIKLVVDCPEAKYVAGVPGLGNVWQLSQAPTAWIQSIPGLGPARRKKLRAYLVSKNVPVAWEA